MSAISQRGVLRARSDSQIRGCYHGLAVVARKGGVGRGTFGVPDSPGVPQDYAKLTLTLPFNDIKAFRSVMRRDGKKIAGVIVEPVVGNIGCVLPVPGFLASLREETERCGAVLIFDEVMTGFRVALGGAQQQYGIVPDLTCLGKVIGGGLPSVRMEATGNHGDISPEGPVYQPERFRQSCCHDAGIETLKILRNPQTYRKLEKTSRNLRWPERCCKKGGVANRFIGRHDVLPYSPMWTWLLRHCQYCRYGAVWARFPEKLEQGIYLAPSQFEAGFLSCAHRSRYRQDRQGGVYGVQGSAVMHRLTHG
jgi:glutamate-1-semialdehyde 2,1-aminomutase